MSQSISETPLTAGPLAPKDERRAAQASASRWQLRLIIAVPVLLILVSLAHGLISYLAFSSRWDELHQHGAGPVASELLRIHLYAMIGLTVVATGMGLALTRTILKPIRSIIEATRLIARGRLDQRAPELPAARELDDLSHSFNAMVEKLNQSIAARHRSLMENIPLGVIMADPAGRISALNPVAAELLGLPAGQLDGLIGLPVATLSEGLPAQASLLADYMAVALSPGRRNGEDTPEPAQEITLPGPREGQELLVTVTRLQNPGGTMPFGVMFSLREASSTQGLSDDFGRTDQLAALGAFTLGLAHELRNPLGAIKGLSQLLVLERGLPASADGFLRRMIQEVDRVDAFVRQLFDLAEQPAATLTPTDFAQCVRLAAERVRHDLPLERVQEIEWRLELEPLPPRRLEGDRLTHALVKLIQNACESTPPGGAVTLRTREETRTDHPVAMIEICNTGPAIAPDLRRKIFEPFFTTRDKATGLGLTIANQIVVQNGGTIELRCGDGEVTFAVVFDRARQAHAGQGEGETP